MVTACAGQTATTTTTSTTATTITTTTTLPPTTSTTIDYEQICTEALTDWAGVIGGFSSTEFIFDLAVERLELSWKILYRRWEVSVDDFNRGADHTREKAREMRDIAQDAPGLVPDSYMASADAYNLYADAYLIGAAAADAPDIDLLDEAKRKALDAEILFDRIDWQCDPNG